MEGEWRRTINSIRRVEQKSWTSTANIGDFQNKWRSIEDLPRYYRVVSQQKLAVYQLACLDIAFEAFKPQKQYQSQSSCCKVQITR